MHDVLTMPLVLPTGALLTADGLDRKHGIVFRIDPALVEMVPDPKIITSEDVKKAMRFLCEEWLVDVSTDMDGKCVLLAFGLSIIERALLDERPYTFATAGKRGGGKTTALNMMSFATTGKKAPAAAWTDSEEERRKAVLAYLSQALPILVWDNIAAGAVISSPTLEKVSTSPTYTDRKLGVSEALIVPTSTIMGFTGNNIAPCGDLSSRSLIARINVDRPDPENRKFEHPFPFDWTLANRGKILKSLYTVMLGNPQLGKRLPAGKTTRFKMWWMVIGSALEYAAKQLGQEVSFSKLFENVEAEDESTAYNVEILIILAQQWPDGNLFKAADVLRYVNDTSDQHDVRKAAAAFFAYDANGNPIQPVSAISIGKRLAPLVNAPFAVGDDCMIMLTTEYDGKAKANRYKIKINGKLPF